MIEGQLTGDFKLTDQSIYLEWCVKAAKTRLYQLDYCLVWLGVTISLQVNEPLIVEQRKEQDKGQPGSKELSSSSKPVHFS